MASASPEVDVDQLLKQLTLEEKISLLAGKNFWETVPIERLGIPSAKVSDGPNGARGAQFQGGVRAACFPASSCLAAGWDREVVSRIGVALAEETRSKGAICLLGPTVCPHRSPLGGRNFESFSEDPFLAGKLASTYIQGLQGQGVSATIKHFAANEQETRRFTMNVNVSERALREIYLKPFEIAIKEAKPWALMTSYNLVNGTHADMNEYLLQTVLREQWGYNGLVMSDWGGCNSMAESINAGLDLEMPGPTIHRKTEDVKRAVESGKIDVKAIDARALAILKFVKQTGKFEHPETPPEQAIVKPEHQKLIREAGAQGVVLLKNEKSILPLKAKELKSVAALGLAKECLAHGGGSAAVNCHYKVTPYEALERVLGKDVKLEYAQGAQVFRNLPDMKDDLFDLDGKPGLTLSRYQTRDFSGEPEAIQSNETGSYMPIETRCAAVRIEGTYKPSVSGSHYMSFCAIGPSKLFINDKLIFNITKSSDDPMGFLFGGVVEEKSQVDFVKGQEYKVRVESIAPVSHPDNKETLSLLDGLLGVRLGFMTQEIFEEDLLASALEVAKSADVALIFVGNTTSWETEGLDMDTMLLPAHGSQDRLIFAVSAVNDNVIVINNTGVAINMPWLDRVSAVLQAWFPGQEAGNSIVDVLFGTVNPGGKLPITIPTSLADTPSFGNFPGDVEKLQVHYEEGIYIGYRYYDKYPEKVLFPFGFGLSYSEFKIGGVKLQQTVLKRESSIIVQADVENIGSVAGSEVVQVYIAPPKSSVDRPLKVLAGFAKVTLEPGQSKTAEVEVSFDSAAYWNENSSLWMVEKGEYEILVGNSSVNILAKERFSVDEDVTFKP